MNGNGNEKKINNVYRMKAKRKKERKESKSNSPRASERK